MNPHRPQKITTPPFQPRPPSARFASLPTLASLLSALFLLLPCLAPATEPEPAAAFDRANHLYEQGRYEEAARAYEELLARGLCSAAILYNRGNAWFKAGRIGRAIASWRQALELAPRDPEIRNNLNFARQQVHGPSLQPEPIQTLLQRLTLNEWTWATVIPFWLTMLLLMAGHYRPAWRPRLRTALWICCILTLGNLALLTAAFHLWKHGRPAVVLQTSTPVRNGPFDESPVLLELHDGAEVRVLEQKDDWVRVTADGSRSGWMPRSALWIPETT